MSITNAILATLWAEGSRDSENQGSIHGRTLLQKKMYFLAVLSHEEFGFRPHYFGPYSPQVSTSLSALIEAGFVKETRIGYGVQTTFGEMTRFDYRLTESGLRVVKGDPTVLDPYRKQLSKINSSEIASDLETMAIAAKVHFVIPPEREVTINEIKKEAQSLGWTVPDASIDEVIEYLVDQIDVVTVD